jgi:hypothetical protein
MRHLADSGARVQLRLYIDGNHGGVKLISLLVLTLIGGCDARLCRAGWTASNGLATTLGYDTDGRLTGISVPGWKRWVSATTWPIG